MAQDMQNPGGQAGASRELLGGCSLDSDSLSIARLQARLAHAPYAELVDDALLPIWRKAGKLPTLGDALALAGAVRRDRLAGMAWHG